MHNILFHLSGLILTDVESTHQEICDGIRSLSNVSFLVYPKNRVLQIILEPRIITNDARIFAMKCSDIKFSEIRNQIICDLERLLNEKKIMLMLKRFTNNLLDNDETLHIHSNDNKCNFQSNEESTLYEKCKSVGLPYGYTNLYPPKLLQKLTDKKDLVGQTIMKSVQDPIEFKNVMRLCTLNYKRVYNVIQVFDILENKSASSLSYLMKLPHQVIKVIVGDIRYNKKHHKISINSIEEIFNIFKVEPELFRVLSENKIICRMFICSQNRDIKTSLLRFINASNKKINTIKKVQSGLLNLACIDDIDGSNNQVINDLIKLCEFDEKNAIQIIEKIFQKKR
jgi:hypothetical protein